MSITTRVSDYLQAQQIQYDVIQHAHSASSLDSAKVAQISAMKLAKAVVLEDHEGRHMMAILPSTNKISFHKLEDEMSRDFHLLSEQDVYKIFKDCEPGAVPPVGHAYHMDSVYDELLSDQKDIFLEGGDHQTLIHLKSSEFKKLMAGCRHSRFSGEVYH
ncbi:MAG: YbaK/EbsC family protein [Bermanella sp.]